MALLHKGPGDQPERRIAHRKGEKSLPFPLRKSNYWSAMRERLPGHSLMAALLLAFVVALLSEMPWLSRRVRASLLEADVVLFFSFLAASGPFQEDLRVAARRSVNVFLLLMLGWCALSALLSPYHAFAIAELLRLALCAGVYFAAAYGLSSSDARLSAYAVVCLGTLVSLYGLFTFGSNTPGLGDTITSIFGNHEQFGSFLVLLLPMALTLAIDRNHGPRWLMASQAAALVIGVALLLARTRSAWAGGAVGLGLLTLLSLRYATARLTAGKKATLIGPLLVFVLGFAMLLAASQIIPLLSKRAATFSHVLDDTSFADRLHRWSSACRMAAERPWAGWGLGSFPVLQGRWTHQGDDVSEVLANGTGHSNLAHNFWVQWAAETGGIGVTLYVATIAAFFIAGIRRLPQMSRSRQTLLIGCLSAVAAGCADMVGAPSYTFPGVSSLFWLWIGLGVAAMRSDHPETSALSSAPHGDWIAALGTGLVSAVIILGVGWGLIAQGQNAPRGTLTVTTDQTGPVVPGTRVLWTATYHDPNGKLLSTAPGTVWTVTQGHLDNISPTYETLNNDPLRSGFQGNVSPGSSSVTVTANYRDDFSRRLTASQTVTLNAGKNTALSAK